MAGPISLPREMPSGDSSLDGNPTMWRLWAKTCRKPIPDAQGSTHMCSFLGERRLRVGLTRGCIATACCLRHSNQEFWAERDCLVMEPLRILERSSELVNDKCCRKQRPAPQSVASNRSVVWELQRHRHRVLPRMLEIRQQPEYMRTWTHTRRPLGTLCAAEPSQQ